MHQPGCSGRSKLFLRLETGRWRLRRRRLVRSRGSGRGSEALLVGLFLLPSLHFFRRDLFEVSGYSPVVAQRIFDAALWSPLNWFFGSLTEVAPVRHLHIAGFVSCLIGSSLFPALTRPP